MRKRRMVVLLVLGCVALAAAGLFYLLALQGIGIGCPVYQLTGLRCPGCGNSRAILACFRLDLMAAWQHNWMFPLEFGYLLWVAGNLCVGYLRTGRFSYYPKRWRMDAALLAILLLWGIFRNIFGI